MKTRNIEKISNGQQGSEVREILNTAIDQLGTVSQEIVDVSNTVTNTIPLTNLEIDVIINN